MNVAAVVSISPFRGATGQIGSIQPRDPVNLESKKALVVNASGVKSSLGTGTVLDISV